MIIADKILNLRKKNNLSQEELAEKLGVSRQSVSKWESAQSIPDINKIMSMSSLFGVSTDYLLKDEMEILEYANEDEIQTKLVFLQEAKDFVKAFKKNALLNALGTMCFILSAAPLLLLSTLAEDGILLSENMANAIGLGLVLGLVALGSVLCMIEDSDMKPYKYIQKGNFELGFGVNGIIKEHQKSYTPIREKAKILSTALYILAAAPFLIASNFELSEITQILFLILLLFLVALATATLIITAGEKNAYKNLLSEGCYSTRGRQRSKKEDKIDDVYWPIVLTIYLGWSFWSHDWNITWIIWPIAMILNSALISLFVGEE